MKQLLFLLLSLNSLPALAESKTVEKLGASEISITQNLIKGGADSFAEIDVEIKKDKQILSRKKISSGGSVGGFAGASIPDKQIFKEAFIFRVDGDYDPRLFVLYPDGGISEFAAGDTFVQTDKKVILTYAGGGAIGGHLIIFDISQGKPIFQLTDWSKVEKFINTEENEYAPVIFDEGYYIKEWKRGDSSSDFKVIAVDFNKKALRRLKRTPKTFKKKAQALTPLSPKWKRL